MKWIGKIQCTWLLIQMRLQQLTKMLKWWTRHRASKIVSIKTSRDFTLNSRMQIDWLMRSEGEYDYRGYVVGSMIFPRKFLIKWTLESRRYQESSKTESTGSIERFKKFKRFLLVVYNSAFRGVMEYMKIKETLWRTESSINSPLRWMQ